MTRIPPPPDPTLHELKGPADPPAPADHAGARYDASEDGKTSRVGYNALPAIRVQARRERQSERSAKAIAKPEHDRQYFFRRVGRGPRGRADPQNHAEGGAGTHQLQPRDKRRSQGR